MSEFLFVSGGSVSGLDGEFLYVFGIFDYLMNVIKNICKNMKIMNNNGYDNAYHL